MTATLLNSYIWLAAYLLSFRGMGWALISLLKAHKSIDFVDQIFLGLSVFIFLGGSFNFLGIVSRTSNFFLFTAGFLLAIVMYVQKLSKSSVSKHLMSDCFSLSSLAFWLLALIVLTSRITTVSWNFADDGEAYFPFAKKMLTTGSLIAEPFSERRTISGFGASTYLDTNVLTFLPFSYIKLSDIGIGFSLLLLLIWKFHRKGYVKGSVFISILPLMLPFPGVNISSLYLSCAYFVYVLSNLNTPILDSCSLFIKFLSPLATLIVLKNSNLIFCALLLMLFSPIRPSIAIGNIRSFFLGLINRLTNFLIVFTLSLPWALSSIKSDENSFTFQNPNNLIFVHRLNFGDLYDSLFFVDWSVFFENLLKANLFGPILVALVLSLTLFKHSTKGNVLFLLRVSLIVFISALFIFISTDGYGIDRYTFPFAFAVFALILFSFSHFIGRGLYFALMLFFLTLSIYTSISKFDLVYTIATLKQRIEVSVIPPDPCNGESDLSKIQNMTEIGSKILVTSYYACQLDFSRNEIVINDFPAMVSPKPGMNLENGFGFLTNYLRSNSFHYILLQFPDEESLVYLQKLANREIDSDWLVSEATLKLKYYDLVLTSNSKIEFVFDQHRFALIRLVDS